MYLTGLFNPLFDRQFVKKKYATDMNWATRHLHGLTWEEGQYPYSLSSTTISHFGSTHQLYAKGHEKGLWLQQYTTYPMVDLIKYGCPATKELPFGCFCTFHNTLERSCGLDKAMRLGQYYMELCFMKPGQVKALCNILS